MIRFVFTFAAWMIFGNWVYDEVSLSFPQAKPVIDETLKRVAIPTHDQWDKEKIISAVNTFSETIQKVSFSFPGLDEIEAELDKTGTLRIPSLERHGASKSVVASGYQRF